jgi:hypothetical protein
LFLDRKVICTATSGDKERIGGIGKVGSVGLVAEYEREIVEHKIGTTMLFKHTYSGDINQSCKNADCTQLSG